MTKIWALLWKHNEWNLKERKEAWCPAGCQVQRSRTQTQELKGAESLAGSGIARGVATQVKGPTRWEPDASLSSRKCLLPEVWDLQEQSLSALCFIIIILLLISFCLTKARETWLGLGLLCACMHTCVFERYSIYLLIKAREQDMWAQLTSKRINYSNEVGHN